MKMRRAFAMLGLGLAITGAGFKASGGAVLSHPAPMPASAWHPRAGDVVLTATADPLNSEIRDAGGGGARHSHAALVVEHDGRPVIVEASPFGDGIARYRDLTAFTTAEDLTDLQVVRPRAALDGRRLAVDAERLVAARVPFDYALDADDPSRLYCSELVADLLGGAGVDVRLRRVSVAVPFDGYRDVIAPDAFADHPGFVTVYRWRG